MRENWTITIEGMGETHNSKSSDADCIMVAMMKELEKNHDLFQARFTSKQGEENFMVFSIREQHEAMAEKGLHDELVEIAARADPSANVETSPRGVRQDADREQGATEVGLRKQRQEHEGRKGRR